MENNYYANIIYEFDTRVKGLRGKFTGNRCYWHKYGIGEEIINSILLDIRKYLQEDSALIDLCIDNSDWYGSPHTIYRLIREWNGDVYLVDFNSPTEPHKELFNTRHLRNLINTFFEIIDQEVKNNANE